MMAYVHDDGLYMYMMMAVTTIIPKVHIHNLYSYYGNTCTYRTIPRKRPPPGKRPPLYFRDPSVSAHHPGKRPPPF